MGKKKIRNSVKSIIYSNKIIGIVSIIVCLFLGLAMIFNVCTQFDNNISATDFFHNGAQQITFLLTFLVGAVVTCYVFKDTYNQQSADMELSAPNNAGQRFISKLLAIFYMHILPLIISAAAGTGAACLIINNMNVRYKTVGMKALLELALGDVSGDIFAIAIMIICLTAMGRCGESFGLALLMMGSISILPLSVFRLLNNFSCGINYHVLNYVKTFWSLSVNLYDEISSDIWEFSYLPHFISILLSIVCIALAFLIYRKRDGKDVGKAIVNKVFFYVCTLVITAAIFISSVVFYQSDIGAFVLSAIVFLVMKAIMNRKNMSLKIFIKDIGICAAELAVLSGVIVLAYMTDGFGINAKKMLSDNNVDAVVIAHYTKGENDFDDEYYCSNEKFSDSEKSQVAKDIMDVVYTKFHSRKHSFSDMISLAKCAYDEKYKQEAGFINNANYTCISIEFNNKIGYVNEQYGEPNENADEINFSIGDDDNWLTKESLEQIMKIGRFYSKLRSQDTLVD